MNFAQLQVRMLYPGAISMRRRNFGPGDRRLPFCAVALILAFLPTGALGAQNSEFGFDAAGNLEAQTTEISTLPRIIGQPQMQIVIPGESASFSVVAADTRGLSFQWRFNGIDLNGATGDALFLTNVSATNEGTYSVVLGNSSGSVTSAPAALFIDADGDGLPDSWELAHFGNLSQNATGDFDGDGVSNLQEFLDGTDPNNPASVFYHLTLINSGGNVTVVPSQKAYTNGATVTLTAIASSGEPFHAWTGDVLTQSNTLTLTMNTNKTLFAWFGPIPFVWTNINGGDWNIASNWSPNLVPGSNDSVLIQISSPVTLNSDANCTDVAIGGGGTSPTLTGSGTLTVRGTLLWSSGTLSGSGRTIVEPGGTFVIDIPVQSFADSRTFELGGTTFWTGTGLVNLNNVVITNRAGALFEAQSSGSFYGLSRFDNAGIFHKPTGDTTGFFNLAGFNNYNIVHIQSGTLLLGGGGTNTGTMTVDSGAMLNLASQTFTSTPESMISGGGQFIFSGGVANFTGTWLCTNNTFNFSGGTANFDGAGTVAPPVLNLTNGFLGGAQTVTVGNAMNWVGGGMNGSGRTVIAPGATLNAMPPSFVSLVTRTLENAGTAMWTGIGSFSMGGVITNRPGALFWVQNALSVNYGGGAPRFDNAGTFRKSTSAGQTSFNGVALNNYSDVDIQTGTLSLLGGGLNNGTITVPAGTALELGGSFNSSVASSISGAGQFTASFGTVTLAGLINVSGSNFFANGTANLTGNYFCTNNTLTISSGTANFDGTGTVAPTVLNLFGTLGGAQTVTVGSVLNWTGGSMSGTGRTVIPPGATLNAAITSFASLVGRTLENGGTTLWTGPGGIGLNDAVITNRLGALFEARNAAAMNFGGGTPRFDNAGTFLKSITPGQTSFNGVLFNNYNDAEIQTGTLSLLGGGLNNGTINVPAGTALELGGSFNSSVASSISGAGQFTASFGTVTLAGLVNVTGSNIFANGTANLTGNYFCTNNTLTISSGTANFDGTGTVAPPVLNLNGTLGGAQTVTVQSVMNWTGGAMNGTGRTVIPAGATLNVALPSFASMTTRTLENGGTTVWTGPGSIALNDAVITNRSGALFSVQNASGMNFGGGAPRFDNAGTLRKSGNTGTTSLNGMNFNNFGTVDLQTGILSSSGGFLFASNSVLSSVFGGTNAGSGFGQLQVSGSVALNGGLRVSLSNGYLPATNDTFAVLAAGTRSGAFTSFAYPSNQVSLLLSNSANSVIVRVTGVALPPPVLLTPALSGSNLLLTWTAISNTAYRVEFNPNLAPSNWTALPGDVTASSSNASKGDTLTPSNRFYRVRVLP